MNRDYRRWCCSVRDVLRANGYRVVANRAFPTWLQLRSYWRGHISPPAMSRRLIDAGLARREVP